MKKNISLLIFAAAALAFSCSKELANPIEKAGEEIVNQTFTATREAMFDTDAKATFDNGIKWQVNDEIAISDGTTQSIFVATAVDESGKATFSLKAGETPLAASGVTYKAWYPKSIAPGANGVMTRPQVEQHANGSIPDGKTINHAPSIYVTNPMYAESQTFELSFKNLCGLLKIVYTGNNIALRRQIFESYTEPLWGPYTIVNNAMVLSNAENKRTELNSTNAKFINQNGVNYVNTYYYAIPAGTYNTLAILTFDNGSGDNSKCQVNGLKDGQTLVVERNKVYTLNVTVNDLRFDLSREVRTANCYTTSKNGENLYMFRATRGNESEIISGIDHVGVVWRAQTWNLSDANIKNKFVVESSLSYKNGYVMFKGIGSRSNVLLAAYDKDGKILWSWHFWSNPSKPLAEVKVNGVTMLDRNLGAIDNDAYAEKNKTTSIFTAGYLYQWGRKDPFPGRGLEGSAATLIRMLDSDNNIMGSTVVDEKGNTRMTAPHILAGPVTVAESVANPEKFIKPAASGQHWASDIVDTWGGETKTIYDPCPYGYRVPTKEDLQMYWVIEKFSPVIKENSENGHPSYHGFYYSDDTNKTFFPITGQMSWGGGTLSGAYLGDNNLSGTGTVEAFGRMWTRDVTANGHTIYQVRGAVAKAASWDARTNSVSFFDNANAYAMAVRCVKE